jgi:NAD(P)-dependent dehydrogenase (short-subunit alcohol dehydrogenase family)
MVRPPAGAGKSARLTTRRSRCDAAAMSDRSPASTSVLRPALFEGRSALLTGGGTGLGLELAGRLAELGASVCLASRSERHLDAGRAEVLRRAPRAVVRTRVLDVRDWRRVRRVVADEAEEAGGLDLLVNNAAGNFVRPSERLPEKAFANVVDIVLNGTFSCSRAFANEAFDRDRDGVILNVVAAYAWHGGPGTLHSAAAKAGVLALTRTLAVEWASRGIRCVAVAPGPFESRGAADRLWPSAELEEAVRGGVPQGRFADRAEVAEACAWLLSAAAAHVTGEVLTIDGGAWLGRGILGPRAGGRIPTVRRRR